jgi:hypothetical protein
MRTLRSFHEKGEINCSGRMENEYKGLENECLCVQELSA